MSDVNEFHDCCYVYLGIANQILLITAKLLRNDVGQPVLPTVHGFPIVAKGLTAGVINGIMVRLRNDSDKLHLGIIAYLSKVETAMLNSLADTEVTSNCHAIIVSIYNLYSYIPTYFTHIVENVNLSIFHDSKQLSAIGDYTEFFKNIAFMGKLTSSRRLAILQLIATRVFQSMQTKRTGDESNRLINPAITFKNGSPICELDAFTEEVCKCWNNVLVFLNAWDTDRFQVDVSQLQLLASSGTPFLDQLNRAGVSIDAISIIMGYTGTAEFIRLFMKDLLCGAIWRFHYSPEVGNMLPWIERNLGNFPIPEMARRDINNLRKMYDWSKVKIKFSKDLNSANNRLGRILSDVHSLNGKFAQAAGRPTPNYTLFKCYGGRECVYPVHHGTGSDRTSIQQWGGLLNEKFCYSCMNACLNFTCRQCIIVNYPMCAIHSSRVIEDVEIGPQFIDDMLDCYQCILERHDVCVEHRTALEEKQPGRHGDDIRNCCNCIENISRFSCSSCNKVQLNAGEPIVNRRSLGGRNGHRQKCGGCGFTYYTQQCADNCGLLMRCYYCIQRIPNPYIGTPFFEESISTLSPQAIKIRLQIDNKNEEIAKARAEVKFFETQLHDHQENRPQPYAPKRQPLHRSNCPICNTSPHRECKEIGAMFVCSTCRWKAEPVGLEPLEEIKNAITISQYNDQNNACWIIQPGSGLCKSTSLAFSEVNVWGPEYFLSQGMRFLGAYQDAIRRQKFDMSGRGEYIFCARDRPSTTNNNRDHWYYAFLQIKETVLGKIVIVVFPGWAPHKKNQVSACQLAAKVHQDDVILRGDANLRVFLWNDLDKLRGQIGVIRE